MKLTDVLLLPSFLAALTFAFATAAPSPGYSEHLTLLPLPDGHLYAGFNFTATTTLSAYHAQHYRHFPRSLAQILQFSHTKELHLRFAQGRWDEESWGSRPRDGMREGGNGVEIWAWLDSSEEGGQGEERGRGRESVLEERWSTLVNSLSGLFCASLNFIDSTRTTSPILSFSPEGAHSQVQQHQGRLQLLHGTLPHEVVCTENLTPFLKLLSCKGKAGLGSLLDGHKVFDANWQTLAIDVRPICPDAAGAGGQANQEKGKDVVECVLEIQQTVDLVLDIERSMRPRDNPIPRAPPIEDVECDTSKPYHSEDTCFPKRREGEMAWSVSGIFGSSVKGACHIDKTDGKDTFDITLQVPTSRIMNVYSLDDTANVSSFSTSLSADRRARHFRLPPTGTFDLHLPAQILNTSVLNTIEDPPLLASRHLTGHGQQYGGMHAILHNPRPHPQRVIYLETLPWFLRPYMHTLKLKAIPSYPGPQSGKVMEIQPEKWFYLPAVDRKRGTHLELQLTIPAESKVELTYEFEKALLRYTEYPPDANRGFDVPAAVIRVLPPSDLDIEPALRSFDKRSTSAVKGGARAGVGGEAGKDGQGSYYLRTTALLLPLPTPDFSMPYNVIILTSTVIALGFGSIFNLLTRRLVLEEEVPESKLKARVRGLVAKIRGGVAAGKGGVVEEKGDDGKEVESKAKGEVAGKSVSGARRRHDVGNGDAGRHGKP